MRLHAEEGGRPSLHLSHGPSSQQLQSVTPGRPPISPENPLNIKPEWGPLWPKRQTDFSSSLIPRSGRGMAPQQQGLHFTAKNSSWHRAVIWGAHLSCSQTGFLEDFLCCGAVSFVQPFFSCVPLYSSLLQMTRGPRTAQGACVCPVPPVLSDSLWPHGLQPTRILCPWHSPGKNTGVGCHALFQENSDPGTNPGCPVLQVDSLLLSYWESP